MFSVKSCLTVGVALVVTAFSSNANASGFAVYAAGAKEQAMGNSVRAHSEGPASAYHNPALMTELVGTQAQIGTTLVFPSREFKSSQTGQTAKTDSDVFFPSTLFVTHQVSDQCTAGLAILNPFGLATDWGKTWEGRYLATNSEIKTYNINPNIAWEVNDRLSLAAGVDFLLFDATLENNINLSTYGLPDAEQKFEGDGHGYGYNLGLLCRPIENWSFGASYRSRINVDVEGKAKFKRPTSQNPSINTTIQTLFPDTDGSTEINLPAQLFVGLCYQGIDKLTVELGARWEEWSCYKELAFNFDKPVAGSNTSVIPKKWHDTYSVVAGGKYEMTDAFAMLASVFYERNPIPNETFDPRLPSADKYGFGLGIAKTTEKFNWAISYFYEEYYSREKNNSLGATKGGTANGEYDTDIHIVAVSVGYTF